MTNDIISLDEVARITPAETEAWWREYLGRFTWVHDSHQIETWSDHVECLLCGLNTAIAGETARLADPCEGSQEGPDDGRDAGNPG